MARTLLVCALVALGGCTQAARRIDAAPTELRVPLARDIQSLDPLDADEIVTFNVVRQLYEGLVDYDPRTLVVVPRLARTWRVADGGRRWTFELVRGARFVGDPCFPGGRSRAVTAEDARFSIERGLSRAAGQGGRAHLPPVAGLDEFLAGRSARVAGIATPSETSLTVSLLRPDPALLHFLAAPRCRIVPREAVEAYGPRFREHAVGTGPFRLVSWESLAGILLVRNRDYWRAGHGGVGLPRVDALRFVPFWTGEENRLFADGGLDMVFRYVSEAAGAEEMMAPIASGVAPGIVTQRFIVPRLNTIFARFDYHSRHPLVRELGLREALSLAVPRPAGFSHVAAHGLLPPGIPGYDSTLAGQYQDSVAARRMLASAGHVGGRGLPPLKIAWRDWDRAVGTRLASDLERLGLRVTLTLYGSDDYWPAVRAGRADLFRDGWMADYPDPQTFLQLFYSGSPDDRGDYRNAEYDRLFVAFRAEQEPQARLGMARRLERMLIDDAAAVFIHHEREAQVVASRVVDWQDNCTNALNVCFYENVGVRADARSRVP